LSDDRSAQRRYVIEAGRRYWPRAEELVDGLPVIEAADGGSEPIPPRLTEVEAPEWARDVAAQGVFLVPSHTVVAGPGPPWQRTDWWRAIFWFLSGSAERVHEAAHGVIHSYSARLSGWDERLWTRAWVNRMALFLRRWASRAAGRAEDEAFGPLPAAELILTHDVDAIRKTLAIRVKQSAFCAFNAGRRLAGGRLSRSAAKLAQAGRFLFAAGDYWCFDTIAALEEARGLRSHFNFYAGRNGRRSGPRERLFDPGYAADEPRLKRSAQELHRRGWAIGLHPSFASWGDPGRIAEERDRLERSLGLAVTSCRQHWLRFSWGATWRAQQEAGLALDTTLGFNDRPGFRNGAALRFRPWDEAAGRPLRLEAIPLVLMDSHLYDYADLPEEQRHQEMARWVDEVRLVRGTATLLWHQQTFARDYGWAQGFHELVAMVAG
jgi:hypothetical protein